MGVTSSKAERSEALRLCKERKKFIKQAIDSRYALAAAHVSYVSSLRTIGIALRRYAEAEVLIETSDKTPSHSSFPSPSPSPLLNGSPHSPVTTRLSYMRSGGGNGGAVTVTVSPPPRNMYMDDGDSIFASPPPPPPPESEWDFFDPVEDSESFRFVGHDLNLGNNGTEEEFLSPKSSTPEKTEQKENTPSEQSNAKNAKKEKINDNKEISTEREDPTEFITHRAKDFLSSIKDIEHRFFRASESGKEVSRMLEANKIRVGYSETKGKSPASLYLASFSSACCRGGPTILSDETEQHVTKVITWKRTTSSRSSSSRNPLTKDENEDSGSDFIEEFCMIAGSHSSTLDRLYAWERKLYDEVKASESIRKEYDRKCDQLRQQFAKDVNTQIIDKTRSIAKDLHSRIRVALHAVDTISKRIEKMRDDELLPQLLELIQGLIRMWKAMLECHHAQYITISLAYHGKTNTKAGPQKEIMGQLLDEVECFGLSFANWINGLTLYVEALNSWLQNCIMQPRERSKGRRAFSPRRVVAPPIFVICRDLSAGIKSLPSQELSDAIRAFLYALRLSVAANEESEKSEANDNGEGEVKEVKVVKEGIDDDRAANLSSIHTSLTKVLDRLTKFSEGSLKMFEDTKVKCESARNAYVNYKPGMRSFSI